MQVSVEKTSELSRKMTVRVPEQAIKEKMDVRIKSLAREVKLDGFRPGKVPPQVVRKMYGDRIRGEITGDLIQSSYVEAIESENLKPAGPPQIIPVEKPSAPDGFEYIADFEVYPVVNLDDLAKMQVSRANGQVETADIENMIESLRQQKKDWSAVERGAGNEDQITFHFSGVCEDENFTDGKVENHKLTLGSGQMIPGFEEELQGLATSNTKVFDIQFPEKYGNDKLSGKTAQFDIEVVSVEEPILPELDAEFIKGFGVDDGDLDKFREDIKRNLENELEQGIKRFVKNSVMDALYAKIELNLPSVLIDQEVEHLKEPYKANAKRQNKNLEDIDLPTEMFEQRANRRVALGLILAEIVQKNEIKVDDDRVRATLDAMARSYDSPEDVLKWYYDDKNRLAEIEQMTLEDQAVDWILGQVSVTDKTLSFDELTKPQNKEA